MTFNVVARVKLRDGKWNQEELIVLADSIEEATAKARKHFDGAGEICFVSQNSTKVIQ